MRHAFHQELADLETQLEQAMYHTSEALSEFGRALAASSDQAAARIRARAEELRAISRRIDAELIGLAARQTPVAGDLRLVLALVQVAQHGALIANQFSLISEQLELLDPDMIDRHHGSDTLQQMAELASSQLRQAVTAFATRDEPLARRIEPQDDTLDRLNRQLFEATLQLEAVADQRELAMRHMLIARSLERVGDNAVDIAEQAAFVVTAELHEFTDASRPRPLRSPSGDRHAD